MYFTLKPPCNPPCKAGKQTSAVSRPLFYPPPPLPRKATLIPCQRNRPSTNSTNAGNRFPGKPSGNPTPSRNIRQAEGPYREHGSRPKGCSRLPPHPRALHRPAGGIGWRRPGRQSVRALPGKPPTLRRARLEVAQKGVPRPSRLYERTGRPPRQTAKPSRRKIERSAAEPFLRNFPLPPQAGSPHVTPPYTQLSAEQM